MNPRDRLRSVRILFYVGGLILVLLAGDGKFCQQLGGAITGFALLLYWLERPVFFRLVMMWCAAFLLIITSEALLDDGEIIRALGRGVYDEAARYLVAAHLATLLGHDLVYSEREAVPPRTRIELNIAAVLPVLLVASIVVIAYYIPAVVRTYSGGRAAQDGVEVASVGGALLNGIATSTGVAIPIVATWCARKSSGASRRILLMLAIGMMSIQFLIAVRFLLLFAAVGSAIVWIAPRRPDRRTMVRVAIFAVVLVMVSTVIRKTRTYGLEGADVGRIIGDMSADDVVLKEGVVKTVGQGILYTRLRGYKDGASTVAILVFWIPRALWSSKPTLMGYWLPREFRTRGFSEGFSAAQGFAGNAYVDFGFYGGLVFWWLGGMVFGLLERRTARICASEDDARILLVAPLFGGTFFAVRSVDTTFLVLVGVMLFLFGVIAISGRRRPAIGAASDPA